MLHFGGKMCEIKILFIILIGANSFQDVLSYSNGNLLPACESMTPDHSSILPQNTPSPYKIEAVQMSSEEIMVILNATSEPFRGFLLEAEDSLRRRPFGTFILVDPTQTQTLNCSGTAASAVSHRRNDDKREIRVRWKSPMDGNYTFRATFVRRFNIFWVADLLDPITTTVATTTTTVAATMTPSAIMSLRPHTLGIGYKVLRFDRLLETKLASHRQGISDDLNKALAALEGKLDGIKTTVTANSLKLTALETSVNDLDKRLAALEAKTSTPTASNAKLAAKIIDLESRSRRNNIRVIGLPEAIEGTQLTAFFSNMLGEVFGDVLGSPPECERAHRSVAPKPAPHQRPRPVIIRLLKFQEKDRIIREARLKRGQLKFRNHSILVFADYPPEAVAELQGGRRHFPFSPG
ncbi:hypothetical protein GJAV_G00082520 [Gymnothorax javanicus]|nr:hypothetical protein GJAV_G00082520 [Gymnothorax javanicus]